MKNTGETPNSSDCSKSFESDSADSLVAQSTDYEASTAAAIARLPTGIQPFQHEDPKELLRKFRADGDEWSSEQIDQYATAVMAQARARALAEENARLRPAPQLVRKPQSKPKPAFQEDAECQRATRDEDPDNS